MLYKSGNIFWQGECKHRNDLNYILAIIPRLYDNHVYTFGKGNSLNLWTLSRLSSSRMTGHDGYLQLCAKLQVMRGWSLFWWHGMVTLTIFNVHKGGSVGECSTAHNWYSKQKHAITITSITHYHEVICPIPIPEVEARTLVKCKRIQALSASF